MSNIMQSQKPSIYNPSNLVDLWSMGRFVTHEEKSEQRNQEKGIAEDNFRKLSFSEASPGQNLLLQCVEMGVRLQAQRTNYEEPLRVSNSV